MRKNAHVDLCCEKCTIKTKNGYIQPKKEVYKRSTKKAVATFIVATANA